MPGCSTITWLFLKWNSNHILLEMIHNETVDLWEAYELKGNIHKGHIVWVVLMTHQKIAALQSLLHALVFKTKACASSRATRGTAKYPMWNAFHGWYLNPCQRSHASNIAKRTTVQSKDIRYTSFQRLYCDYFQTKLSEYKVSIIAFSCGVVNTEQYFSLIVYTRKSVKLDTNVVCSLLTDKFLLTV